MINVISTDLANQMKVTGVWKEGCPIPIERLSLVEISYVDFDGNEQNNGEIIVLDVAAEHVAAIFSELHKMRFPISKIRSMHHYNGDDLLSMEENNTSCFNYRTIEGMDLISLHSYGLAIDLNPMQNPIVYLDANSIQTSSSPSSGKQFTDRKIRQPGMVEEVSPIFAQHGYFVWGGNWGTPIDYHHFQTPRVVAELLAMMDYNDGKKMFELCIKHQLQLSMKSLSKYAELLSDAYRKGRADFFSKFLQYIEEP